MPKKVIFSADAPEPIGPYSQAIQVDQTIYVSGQIAMDPRSGALITSGIEDETHQVFKNIKAILNAAGIDFSHVVKVSIFLSDMGNFGRVNEIYGTYFKDTFPARETVEVSKLPKNVNIEISCIAFTG